MRRFSHAFRSVAFSICFALALHSFAWAASKAISDPATAKQQLTQRGVGKQVKLIRRDGSEVKGQIAMIGVDSVQLRMKGFASPTDVPLADIAAVKGPGLSTGAKVGIGIGVGVVVTVGILALVVKHELDKPWSK